MFGKSTRLAANSQASSRSGYQSPASRASRIGRTETVGSFYTAREDEEEENGNFGEEQSAANLTKQDAVNMDDHPIAAVGKLIHQKSRQSNASGQSSIRVGGTVS